MYAMSALLLPESRPRRGLVWQDIKKRPTHLSMVLRVPLSITKQRVSGEQLLFSMYKFFIYFSPFSLDSSPAWQCLSYSIFHQGPAGATAPRHFVSFCMCPGSRHPYSYLRTCESANDRALSSIQWNRAFYTRSQSLSSVLQRDPYSRSFGERPLAVLPLTLGMSLPCTVLIHWDPQNISDFLCHPVKCQWMLLFTAQPWHKEDVASLCPTCWRLSEELCFHSPFSLLCWHLLSERILRCQTLSALLFSLASTLLW